MRSYLALNLIVFNNLLESLRKCLKTHWQIYRVVVNRTEGVTMQHDYILGLAETRAHEKDSDWLTRAKGLSQSDLWSANTRLYDRP